MSAMRFRTWTPVAVLTTVLSAILTLVPASPAAAVSTRTYQVSGVEVFATSTEGVFVGTTSRAGNGAGTWYADVLHRPLRPDGAIDGGSFGMLLTSAPHLVTGRFTSGQVTQLRDGSNCTNQRYSVTGKLQPVSFGRRSAVGRFDVLLTHYRTRFLDRCRTYGATVEGTVKFR
jgi:hypothetical protein